MELSDKDRAILSKVYRRLARLGEELAEKEKARSELGGSTGQSAEQDTENVSVAS